MRIRCGAAVAAMLCAVLGLGCFASTTGPTGADPGLEQGDAGGSGAGSSAGKLAGAGAAGSTAGAFPGPIDAGRPPDAATRLDAGAADAGRSVDAGRRTDAMSDASVVEDGGLELLFSPMYSGHDGVHIYQVPVLVRDPPPGLQWSAEPASAVSIESGAAGDGMAMITTRAAGTVTIRAQAGGLRGAARLHITVGTPEQWELGEQLYNTPAFERGNGEPSGFEYPDELSCEGCHGSNAQSLDVEHSPQQVGGHSDEELIATIFHATRKPGGGMHTPFPETVYDYFHKWQASDAEQRALVLYLRSLTPRSQGVLDFGGASF